ncbi:MAG: hypothetical protein RLZZ428_661, partial [Pseudomonadota bacterium]
MALIEEYKAHTAEREALGVPPLPLTPEQVAALVELLKVSPIADEAYAMDMFENKIPAGVDDAAYVKAAFLNDVVQGKTKCDAITPVKGCEILGKMLGGFNVTPLVEALKLGGDVANAAAEELKNTLLVYNSFNDVKTLMDQ